MKEQRERRGVQKENSSTNESWLRAISGEREREIENWNRDVKLPGNLQGA